MAKGKTKRTAPLALSGERPMADGRIPTLDELIASFIDLGVQYGSGSMTITPSKKGCTLTYEGATKGRALMGRLKVMAGLDISDNSRHSVPMGGPYWPLGYYQVMLDFAPSRYGSSVRIDVLPIKLTKI